MKSWHRIGLVNNYMFEWQFYYVCFVECASFYCGLWFSLVFVHFTYHTGFVQTADGIHKKFYCSILIKIYRTHNITFLYSVEWIMAIKSSRNLSHCKFFSFHNKFMKFSVDHIVTFHYEFEHTPKHVSTQSTYTSIFICQFCFNQLLMDTNHTVRNFCSLAGSAEKKLT